MPTTKTAHTPGPWKITNHAARKYISSEERITAEALPVNSEDELQANARLIAAAPELLTVAQGCLGYLQALPEQYRPDPAWFTPLVGAIKKATE